MQNQLRVLSGLHRGAVLPLDDETLLLGAHEDADVVLVDPGIVAHHACLQVTDAGWMLTTDAGPIYSATEHAAQSLIDLVLGSLFRIGETWLAISAEDAPWQSVPPMPLPEVESALPMESLAQEATALAEEASVTVSAVTQAPPITASELPATPVPETQSPPASAAPKKPRRQPWRRWMFAPAALAATLTAVAAFAYTAKPSQPSLRMSAPVLAGSDTQSTKHAHVGANDGGDLTSHRSTLDPVDDTTTPEFASPGKPSAALSQSDLRNAFRKRLKDAELLLQFDLDLNETGWTMRAHLDDAEAARFERILKHFVVEHKVVFPINAKVGNAESMLPFRIQQVISGTNAGIVTSDGERFYVGDEFQGVRLLAVVDNHLTFIGKRKIEVIW